MSLYLRPLIPPPVGIPPKPIGDAKAKRTLVTVASGDKATDKEPSKGAEGFMGPKIKKLLMAARAAEPTPAPVLDDRETPCVAENDCGAKSSPAPVSFYSLYPSIFPAPHFFPLPCQCTKGKKYQTTNVLTLLL